MMKSLMNWTVISDSSLSLSSGHHGIEASGCQWFKGDSTLIGLTVVAALMMASATI